MQVEKIFSILNNSIQPILRKFSIGENSIQSSDLEFQNFITILDSLFLSNIKRKESFFSRSGNPWDFIKNLRKLNEKSKSDFEILSKLNYVKTDFGFVRAWLRQSLMFDTIESDLTVLLSNDSLIATHYESPSPLLSQEFVDLFNVLWIQLQGVSFDLIIDDSSLDTLEVMNWTDVLMSNGFINSDGITTVSSRSRSMSPQGQRGTLETNNITSRKEDDMKENEKEQVVEENQRIPRSFNEKDEFSINNDNPITITVDTITENSDVNFPEETGLGTEELLNVDPFSDSGFSVSPELDRIDSVTPSLDNMEMITSFSNSKIDEFNIFLEKEHDKNISKEETIEIHPFIKKSETIESVSVIQSVDAIQNEKQKQISILNSNSDLPDVDNPNDAIGITLDVDIDLITKMQDDRDAPSLPIETEYHQDSHEKYMLNPNMKNPFFKSHSSHSCVHSEDIITIDAETMTFSSEHRSHELLLTEDLSDVHLTDPELISGSNVSSSVVGDSPKLPFEEAKHIYSREESMITPPQLPKDLGTIGVVTSPYSDAESISKTPSRTLSLVDTHLVSNESIEGDSEYEDDQSFNFDFEVAQSKSSGDSNTQHKPTKRVDLFKRNKSSFLVDLNHHQNLSISPALRSQSASHEHLIENSDLNIGISTNLDLDSNGENDLEHELSFDSVTTISLKSDIPRESVRLLSAEEIESMVKTAIESPIVPSMIPTPPLNVFKQTHIPDLPEVLSGPPKLSFRYYLNPTSNKQKTCSLCNRVPSRFCHYFGSYFCDQCHVNDKRVLPGLLIEQWDDSKYPVCKVAALTLDRGMNSLKIDIVKSCPILISQESVLSEALILRNQLFAIVKFIQSCNCRHEKILLSKLGKRVYFIDDTKKFLLQDLVCLKNKELIPYLQKYVRELYSHCRNCDFCSPNGQKCIICGKDPLLFPFLSIMNNNVVQCKKCKALMHLSCLNMVDDCPNCSNIH
eukprot:TRINITY_DN2298_c0_g2_i1.p1 TRINITY_DN2298_c0_g2~~TRINITY_DN2298_c0_g2_i1.p1  ORF type:complete len:967 (+),score=246.27 TRINITY_DN2298_c0_g2_i1:61-2961(+)